MRSRRLSGPQLAACARGLALMGAKPSPAWLARLWADSHAHLANQPPTAVNRLSLRDLAALGSAAGLLARNDAAAAGPPDTWKDAWRAAALRDIDAAIEPTSPATVVAAAGDAVALVLAARELGVQLPAAPVLALLQRACVPPPPLAAAAADGEAKPAGGKPAAAPFHGVPAVALAELGPALRWLGVDPDPSLRDAYVQVSRHQAPQMLLLARDALRPLSLCCG